MSPQQKKALAYRKDHPLQAAYPHAFRQHWPRQKAAANRAYRHRVRQALGAYRGAIEEEHDRSASARVRAARRRFVRKWGGAPLSLVIQERQRRRIARTARQYFRDPYLAERDRQGFCAFLAALTSTTAHQHGMARRFADLLTASRHDESDMPVYLSRAVRSTHSTWLRAFLRDEPEWEPRLRAWIARVLGE